MEREPKGKQEVRERTFEHPGGRKRSGKTGQHPNRKENERQFKYQPKNGIDRKVSSQMADLVAENNALRDIVKEKEKENSKPPKTKQQKAQDEFDELPPSTFTNKQEVKDFEIHCGKRPTFEINLTWLLFSAALSFFSFCFGFNLMLPFVSITGEIIKYSFKWYHYLIPPVMTIAVFWLHKFGYLEPNHIRITYARPASIPTTDRRPDVIGSGDLKHKDPHYCYVFYDTFSRTKVKFIFNVFFTDYKFSRNFDFLVKRTEKLISMELYSQIAVSKFANNMDEKEVVFANLDFAAKAFQSVNLGRDVSLLGPHEKMAVNNTVKVAYYAYREYMEHSSQDFLLPPTRARHFYMATDSEKLISPLSGMLNLLLSFLKYYRWILVAGLLFKYLLPLLS